MDDKVKENQKLVKELMESAEAVRLGNELKEGVSIDYTSLEGNSYKGTVVFKRPSMKDYMKMGALKSEYLRQAGTVDINLVDRNVKEMAQVMATLKIVVLKCPAWLRVIEDIVEPDVLYHVYAKYEVWEGAFRRQDKAETTGDSRASE